MAITPPKPGQWGQIASYPREDIVAELVKAGVPRAAAEAQADAIVNSSMTATQAYMAITRAASEASAPATPTTSVATTPRISNMRPTGNLGMGTVAVQSWKDMVNSIGAPVEDRSRAQDAAGAVANQMRQDGYREVNSFFEVDPDTVGAPMSTYLPGNEMSVQKMGRERIFDLIDGTMSQQEVMRRAMAMEDEDPDLITQLQMELIQHDLLAFGDAPVTWGVLDDATKMALSYMVSTKAGRPSQNWTGFLDSQRKQAETKIMAGLAGDKEADAQALADLSQSLSQNLELRLSSSDTIREVAQMTARQMLGRELSNDDVDALTSSIHAKERDNFWADPGTLNAQRQLAEANKKLLALKNGSTGDLDSFMNSIMKMESGGNPNAVNPYSGAFGLFQFMPGTWAGAASEFGLNSGDKSPENQRRVASALMSKYYGMFGNWRDVAIAWYAGPYSKHIGKRGSTQQEANGHISIAGYADKAVAGMQSTAQMMGGAAAQLGALGGIGVLGGAAAAPVALAAAATSEAALGPQGQAAGSSLLEGDIAMPELRVDEYEAFDMQSYLKSLIETQGGVDVDSYRYLTQANAFEDLIRRAI